MTRDRMKLGTAAMAFAAAALLSAGCGGTDAGGGPADAPGDVREATAQAAFATPEEAVQALAGLIGAHDRARAEALFGADGVDLLLSGDEVQDRNNSERVGAAIRESVAFEDGPDGTLVAVFGAEGWPFPVPLVRHADGWRFDVEAGWEEIENRRVGRNEILTLATLHEFVEAQREYASVGRDGNAPQFARKLFSSPGRHDGLYWESAAGEPPSPFGPEIAAAEAEGYSRSEDGPRAFRGYRFRLLTAQGPSAPGGAKDYLDVKGRLTGGFALVAWPAKYGNSGVMTFLVSHRGIVYERDLGEATEAEVAAIAAFDPVEGWEPARSP